MTIPFARIIRIVHELPGRLRLRLPFLHDAPAEATPLADGLASLEGMIEVRIRPYTGSTLCLYDPAKLAMPTILDATRTLTGVGDIVRPGEPLPKAIADRARAAAREPSRLALAAATFFRGVSDDIQIASEGRFDLGMLATVAFAVAGAAEVAA